MVKAAEFIEKSVFREAVKLPGLWKIKRFPTALWKIWVKILVNSEGHLAVKRGDFPQLNSPASAAVSKVISFRFKIGPNKFQSVKTGSFQGVFVETLKKRFSTTDRLKVK